jgi:UDP-N-acetylmuramate dehydrogenase
MKMHTSFRIGGPADFFITLTSIQELKKVLIFVRNNNIPFLIVGNGSNLLVRDKGIRGIVAKLNFNNLEIDKDKEIVKVSSDYPVSKLARKCAKAGLSGIEFLAGIPGTIGGAIRMNAGAYGREMKDIVVTTTCLDEEGAIKKFSNEEQNFEYRNSIFKSNKYIILEVELKLNKDNVLDINKRIDEMMMNRIEKQPVDFPSCGSTFKRLPNLITAKLIDECGLKGYKVGGAEVSTKHAGFIINTGNATAKDVIILTDHIKSEVYQRFNERIELEVLIVGEE